MKYLIYLFYFFNIVCYGQQTICLGSIKDYSVDTTENSGDGTFGSIYIWSVLEPSFHGVITKGNVSGNKIQIDWKTTPIGSYTINIRKTNLSNCSSEKELHITITKESVNLENQYACLDTNNQWVNNVLFATNLDPSLYTFQWYKNGVILSETGSFLSVNQVDTYKVIVQNKLTTCTAEAQAMVIESPKIILNTTFNNNSQYSQEIEVQASGGTPPYFYSLDGIDFQLNNTFTVNHDGTYEIIVKDITDCNTTNIEVFLLKYPKFFTPNGDGQNDTWAIVFPPSIISFKTSIFDRYGKLIRQLNSNEDTWDGTYVGQQLQPSDYWFVSDYMDINNNKRQFKSHFSLNR